MEWLGAPPGERSLLMSHDARFKPASMDCPRCLTALLDEKERAGVVVDVCVECRGVWLDRGELEKLVARARREMDDLEARPGPARGGAYDVDDDEPSRHGRHPEPKKKRWVDTLGDLFD
jgi:uncharacterized protein